MRPQATARPLWVALVVLAGFGSAQDQETFSIALIPDTQNYTEIDPELYFKQMRFIVRARDTGHLAFGIHLGDVTDSNLEIPTQWVIANSAHRILDSAHVPYSVIPGNHDMPYLRLPNLPDDSVLSRDLDVFNEIFGPRRFLKANGQPHPWTGFGGSLAGAPENKYWLFQRGALKLAVIGLELAPRKDAVCWANQLARQLSDRIVIVATHCYQTHDGRHESNCAVRYGLVGSGGDVLFRELVKQHSNIQFVVSGHINEAEHKARPRDFGGTRRDSVHEILTDYQNEREILTNRKSGNGWLRVMNFFPQRDSVFVQAHTVSNVTVFRENDYHSSKDHTDHSFGFRVKLRNRPPAIHLDNLTEFHDRTANPASKGRQQDPAIASSGNGKFITAWADDADGNGKGQVHARAFDANGCEAFRITPVNSQSDGDQGDPAVTMNASGASVVAWQSDHDNDGKYQVFARGFRADGSVAFADIAVSDSPAGQQVNPTVAMSNSGDFVVAWQDFAVGGQAYRVKARRFRSDGTYARSNNGTVLPPIVLDSRGTGTQRHADAAMAPNGDFVVVWEDDSDGNNSYQIRARGYRHDGGDWFGPATANAESSGQQRLPAVAIAPSRKFVVVWADDRNNNNTYQIRGRAFDHDASPRGNDFLVNSVSAGEQTSPDVAMSPSGGFVVVWADDRNDNATYQIRSRVFDATGVADRGDAVVNFNPAGQQRHPVVAVLTAAGRFVVGWQDDSNRNLKEEILVRGIVASARLR